MKKIAIISILVVLFGAMPIYAADSSNDSAVEQLQSDNPQLYQDLIDLKSQIMQNPDQIIQLLQNKDIQDQIQQGIQSSEVQNKIHEALQNPTVQNDLKILFQNQNIKNDVNNILNS